MEKLVSEFIGTFLLILLGNGAVANVVLQDTKGHAGGWIVIAVGWGLAVFVAVAVAGPVSGAHINPAVTLGLALAGLFAWSDVFWYILAQIAGAAAGALLVWVFYRHHFNRTEDPGLVLACYSTSPAIRKPANNFISELTGTFVLVFVILYFAGPSFTMEDGTDAVIGMGSLGALPVALLVTAIGLSLGGTTGYAINPARDFGPRIMHTVLPMDHKGGSDWGYAWIPFLGPCTGGIIAALLYQFHGILFS